MSGDSGCPVFLEIEGVPCIAGLNSYGDSPDGVGIGQYGARDYQTRVSRYLDWIDATVETTSSSEPDCDSDGSNDDPSGSGEEAGRNSAGGCSATGTEHNRFPLILLLLTGGLLLYVRK